MPVPCICAPNEIDHPIALGVERFTGTYNAPLARILSLRTPCDFGEADAVDRLGAVSCIGAINDIREVLRGGTPLTSRTIAATGSGAVAAVSAAAEHARNVRQARRGARTGIVDPFMPPVGDAVDPRPLPWVQHLGRTEYLATARLRRLWPGVAPGDIRVNFKLARPQVQVSSGLIESQAVYEYGQRVNGRRAAPGWWLRDGSGGRLWDADMSIKRTLDELLPAAPMRAVVRFWSRNT